MSLLRDIQDAAIDGNTDLSTVLRKCKVLAARLGYEPFEHWVDWELNGYPPEAELPPYRIFLNMQSMGDFVGAFGRAIHNQPLPILNIPEDIRENFIDREVRDGIAACASCARAEGNMIAPWPPDMVVHLSDKFISGMNLMAARMILPTNLFVGLLDAVRNRLLKFVLEIEKIAPDAGEALLGQQPVRSEKITQVFTTNIYGTSGNVSVGSHGVTQTVEQLRVTTGDLEALRRSLMGLNVDADDMAKLETILQAEPREPVTAKAGPSSRVKGWIADMVAKAADGVWETAVPDATKTLLKVVYGYLGIGG